MFIAELKPGLKRTSLFSNLSRWAVGNKNPLHYPELQGQCNVLLQPKRVHVLTFYLSTQPQACQ